MSSYRSGYAVQPKYKPNNGFKKYTQNKPFRQLIILDLPENLRSIDVLAEKFQPYGRIFGIKFLHEHNFQSLGIEARNYIGHSNCQSDYGAIVEFETARTAKFCCGVLRKRVKQQGFRIAVLKPGAESELTAQKQLLLSDDSADSLYSGSNSSWTTPTKASQSSIDVDVCRSSASSCSDEKIDRALDRFNDLKITENRNKVSKAHLAVGFGRPKASVGQQKNMYQNNFKYRVSTHAFNPMAPRMVEECFYGQSYMPNNYRQLRMTPFDKF